MNTIYVPLPPESIGSVTHQGCQPCQTRPFTSVSGPAFTAVSGPVGCAGVNGPGPGPTGAQGSQFGYHEAKIERGFFGDSSKIREEVEELIDAERQGVRLMQLQELSDIIGAVQGYLVKNHPGTTLRDLIKMAQVTNRAFEVGERNARV